MKNSYWYYLLAIVSIILFIYTLWKKRDPKLIVLFLFMSGITFSFEFVILLFLKSYIYHPNIISNDLHDSILGSFFSNAFAVPMAAVFIAAFNLNFYYILLIIAIFFGIEILFVYLEIYEQLWWKYYYTSIGLLINFYIAKKWYYYLHHNISNKIRAITVYFSDITIVGTTGFLLSAVFNKFVFKFGLYDDPYRDNFILFGLYMHYLSFITVFIVTKELNWLYSMTILLIASFIDYILVANEKLVLHDGFSLFNILLVRIAIVITFKFLDRRVVKKA